MPVPFQWEMQPGRVLNGDFYPCANDPKAVLIVCHGYKGFKDWGMFPYLGERFSDTFDVVTFNFTHNGIGSEPLELTELDKFARNTISREIEDLEALLAGIRDGKEPFKEKALPLVLLGHSRGGGVSLIYAFDHPDEITGVISWNGITDVKRLFTPEQQQEMMEAGRSYVVNARTNQRLPLDRCILEDIEQNRERFDIIGRVREARIPIALIQGTQDMPHLLQGSERLVRNNPSVEWVKIPDGNHTFGARHPFQGTTEPLKKAIAESKRFIRSLIV